ncbi:MAG: MBOAT family O-acyltransferase [Nostoc sp.]
MLFPTYEFLVFFVIVFAIGSFIKKQITAYKYYLICVSLIFYSFWGLQFLQSLFIDIVINYLIIESIERTPYKKQFLFIGIVTNLFYLGFFKYYNFFTDSLYAALNNFHIQASFQTLQILTPIGISFYTFRIISHLVDCYRNQLKCPSLLDYTVYITYFPQVISGPISRADKFYIQLNSQEKYNYQIESVMILIISGLFKKYTLSSFLFNFTQLPFQLPEQYSSFDLILATLAYSCLIYVDFSGYSDLANAISALLGFQPIQNFNMPYRAQSLQEFWRRWHISLSEWLRDYLYIPLGGGRKSNFQKYFNLLLTMIIAGFWHGAGLNFIIWGTLHGIGLILKHICDDVIKSFQSQKNTTPTRLDSSIKNKKSLKVPVKYSHQPHQAFYLAIFNWLCTFIFVNICWIFFNTSSWETAIKFLRRIFDLNSNHQLSQLNSWQLYIIFAMVFIMNFSGDKISHFCEKALTHKNLILQTIFASSTLYVVFRLGPNTVPPFIYFNF